MENHWNLLRDTCNTSQPTQNSITQLHYRTVNAREFISDIHNKYTHYWEEKILNTMLNKLEYTLKIATSKLEELENLDDKIQSNMVSLFKQHFKELCLNPRTVDDTKSDHTMPKSKLYKNRASVGHVTISERKRAIQEKDGANNITMTNSYNQATINNHKSNPSASKKKDGKKNTDSKGYNKNASTTSETSQQHILKTSIKGIQTKESRRPSQYEAIPTFHPKPAYWNGERTKLR